ncbi:MAG: FtsX-like permease family protein [Myxococcota bacterium]
MRIPWTLAALLATPVRTAVVTATLATLFGALVLVHVLSTRLVEQTNGWLDRFDDTWRLVADAKFSAFVDADRFEQARDALGELGLIELHTGECRNWTEPDPWPILVCGMSHPWSEPALEVLRPIEGRIPAPGADEVIVSRAFQERTGVQVGDQLNERHWDVAPVVVGTFAAPPSLTSAQLYTGLEALQGWTGSPTVAWAMMRFDEPPPPDDALLARIDDPHLATMDVLTLKTRLRAASGPLEAALATIRAILTWCGTLVVALTMSFSASQRLGDYALLRSMGARSRHVSVLVLGESLAVAGAGLALGACGAIVLSTSWLADVHPAIAAPPTWGELGRPLVLVTAATLLGAVPAVRIATSAEPDLLLRGV